MLPAEVAICPASPADLPGVQRIFAHYVANSIATFEESPPTVADWHGRLDTLTGLGLPFLVAKDAVDVVGYAYAGPWRPKPAYRHTVEDSIYLDPLHTGRGIGRALLSALLLDCAHAGVRQVIAVIAVISDSDVDGGSDSDSGASTALHRDFGFRHAGRLTAVGHKHGRWADTILMQRDVTEGGLTTGADVVVPGSAVEQRPGSGQ